VSFATKTNSVAGITFDQLPKVAIVSGLPLAPTTDNDLTTKKYVDSKVGSGTGGGLTSDDVEEMLEGYLEKSDVFYAPANAPATDILIGATKAGTVNDNKNVVIGGSIGEASYVAEYATAVGRTSVVKSDGTTAFGYFARATDSGATAVGRNANAAYSNSTALGNGAATKTTNQVVLGSATVTTAAIGPATMAVADTGITFDQIPKVRIVDNLPLEPVNNNDLATKKYVDDAGGGGSSSGGNYVPKDLVFSLGDTEAGNVQLGIGAIAAYIDLEFGIDSYSVEGATAVGNYSYADSEYATAIGNHAYCYSDNSTALGADATSNQRGVAIGSQSTCGDNSITIGYNIKASGQWNMNIGTSNHRTINIGFLTITLANDKLRFTINGGTGNGNVYELTKN
jgi:hypothetical protein